VLVHGNHDSLGGWSALEGAWPPGVTLLGSNDVTAVPIERGGSRLATVYGMSYPKRDVTENLARRFARESAMGVHVGLLHCNVGGDVDHAPYSPCSIDDLRKAGMDYWALGHIHRRQVLRDGAPWVVYPGNTQGRSPKPSECGAKGATVVDVENGRVRALEFVPVDRVRFLKAVVDVSDAADATSVVDAVSRSAAALRSEHDGRGLIIDVELAGAPGGRTNGERATSGEKNELRQQLRRPEVREGMLQELRHEWEGERPFVWWRSLEERTRLQVDPDVVRGRGDFSAQLVEVCDRLAAEPARIETLMDERSEPLRRLFCVPGLPADALEADPAALLAAARALALDLLESDETS
jgi:DNA repair exonuclease SbcCD nuclease subunit